MGDGRIGQVQSTDTGSALTPIKDADVEQSAPTTNFGTSAQMQIKSGGVNRVGMVSFNTAGLANVTSAKLVLFVASADTIGTPVVADVYYAPTATDSWSETGVTWNATPSPGNSPSSGKIATLTISNNVVGTWLSWDVTSSVVADGDGIATFFITCNATASNENVRFSTRETSNPPQLVVTTAPSLAATKDTAVESLNPTTNYGTNAVMQIKSSASISRDALLSFDTSGVVVTGVTSATLRLYVSAMDTTANTIAADVYYTPTASDSWSETGVTWNSTPSPGNAPSSGQIATQNITNALIGSWISWDVTSSVVADSDGTATFLVTADSATPSSANVGFSTREGAHAPQLVIGSATTLALSSQTTSAVASGAIPGRTDVFGGTGPYTCAVTSNTSGGSTCTVSNGVVKYTVGATAGYNIKAQRTNDYLRLVTASGGPYVESGGVLGSTAELWIMAASGAGYTFEAKSTSKYMRNAGTISTGNDLVADVAVGSAGVFARQNCNGTGDPGQYNRFGFSSATGSSPYWQAQAATAEAVNAGSGVPCSASDATAWEAFYLVPGTDTLTITDSASHTIAVTVSVENPIAFLPSSINAYQSTAITPVQAWGGSGVFSGGSSACTVQTNNSGGGACAITGDGLVSYTPGANGGVDTILVTDSQGQTGTFTVGVTAPFAVSSAASYASPSSALGAGVTISGGTAPYTCAVAVDTSGGASCSVSGTALSYTAGTASGYNLMSASTSDYLRLVSASGGPYVRVGGALGSSAELWLLHALGSSFTFRSNSTGLFMRNAGTVNAGYDLVADATASNAGIFTEQNCNPSGTYNRFGFASATGTSPYWKVSSSYVEAVNNGSSTACDAASTNDPTAFFISPGLDTLTISDSIGHTIPVNVAVESPLTFAPSAASIGTGAAMPTIQVTGGSGIFTGGAAGCQVQSAGSGGATCSVTGYGAMTYTAGGAAGTDILKVTDTHGHIGLFTVNVGLTLTQITASKNYFACGVVSDGTARCWGENESGQLGNSTTNDTPLPVAVSGLTGVTAVSAGGYSTCALLSDGTVKCWGANGYGQLGDGTTVDKLAPSTAVGGIMSATAIGMGLNFGCALISGGTVRCWGDDTWGQIGDGSSGSAYPQTTTSVAVANVTGATKIAVGSFHACALVASGNIKCWGDGTMGALGNGASAVSVDAVSVTGITGATEIAAGESSSCAVLSDATVECWGDESYGQLGNGVSNISAFSNVPVRVPFLSSVSSVSIGYPFACARLTSNAVSCWGRNVEGELGDGTSTDRAYATPVMGLSTTSSFAAGGHFVCSILASGLTMCWGYNPYGALGNNTTTDSHYPVPIGLSCTTCGTPDLTVGAVTYTPASVAAGGTVTFSATVWNEGLGRTSPGTADIVGFSIDGTQTNTSSSSYTTSIPPGGSATLSATGIWTTTAGSHTLQGWADYNSNVMESNESNNKTVVNMSVGIDLAISSLAWSPVSPTNGQAVTLSAVVTNVGTVATPGGTVLGVRFDVDGMQATLENNYTTSLAPGASITLTANSGTWSATSGSHTIQAWADSGSLITDVSRTNNKLTRAMTVP